MGSTMVISLLILLLILQAIGIYLLYRKKRFKITSDSATQDIANFLNSLDEEMSERSLLTEKHLATFIEVLKKHETARLNTMYEIKSSNNELLDTINEDVSTSQSEIRKIVSLLNEMLKTHLDDVAHKIGVMKEELTAVKELTQEKDKKIRRYEDGYDQKNIKQFNRGYFKILELIRQEQQNQENEFLSEIYEDLLLLLEDNGIERVDISKGDKYENFSKVAKVVGTDETDNLENDHVIKEIKKDGYFIQVDKEMRRVLQPVEVIVYKLNQKEEGASNV